MKYNFNQTIYLAIKNKKLSEFIEFEKDFIDNLRLSVPHMQEVLQRCVSFGSFRILSHVLNESLKKEQYRSLFKKYNHSLGLFMVLKNSQDLQLNRHVIQTILNHDLISPHQTLYNILSHYDLKQFSASPEIEDLVKYFDKQSEKNWKHCIERTLMYTLNKSHDNNERLQIVAQSLKYLSRPADFYKAQVDHVLKTNNLSLSLKQQDILGGAFSMKEALDISSSIGPTNSNVKSYKI